MDIALSTANPSQPSTPAHDAAAHAPPRWPVWLFRAALLAWAGFWTWFVIAAGFGESGIAKSWPYMLLFLVPITGFTALTLKWPRVGGTLLFAGGLFTAYYFWRMPVTVALFSLPPLVLGAIAMWLGWRR
jgi:hypothetical protein